MTVMRSVLGRDIATQLVPKKTAILTYLNACLPVNIWACVCMCACVRVSMRSYAHM